MATSKRVAAGDLKKYEVISPLTHGRDGPAEDYPVGSTVELTEAEAEQLLGHTVKPLAAG